MSPDSRRKAVNRCWYLYVLKCNDGTLYTGITNNIERRTDQHNRGVASRYTRARLPVQVIYCERCHGRSSALRKEYAFKQLSKDAKVAYIETKSTAARKRILGVTGRRP